MITSPIAETAAPAAVDISQCSRTLGPSGGRVITDAHGRVFEFSSALALPRRVTVDVPVQGSPHSQQPPATVRAHTPVTSQKSTPRVSSTTSLRGLTAAMSLPVLTSRPLTAAVADVSRRLKGATHHTGSTPRVPLE